MVYRPPKKSPHVPAFPPNRPQADPLEGPLTSRPGEADVRAGDDRNLVAVDQSYVGGDLEDQVWLFWQRNGKKVITLVVVLLLGVVVWQGYKLLQVHAQAKLQAEYEATDGPAAWLAFAKAHPASDLGKVAQLQAADAFYKAGKYPDALQAYEEAVTMWGESAVGQRARFARAMTLLKTDEVAGKTALEAIYSDNKNNENYRAQSAYFLAAFAVKGGDGEAAGKWIDRAKGFPTAEPWPSQAEELADLAPILSGVKISTTTTANASFSPVPTAPAAPQPSGPVKIDSMGVAPGTAAPASPPPAPSAPVSPATPATPPSAGNGLSLPDLAPLQK